MPVVLIPAPLPVPPPVPVVSAITPPLQPVTAQLVPSLLSPPMMSTISTPATSTPPTSTPATICELLDQEDSVDQLLSYYMEWKLHQCEGSRLYNWYRSAIVVIPPGVDVLPEAFATSGDKKRSGHTASNGFAGHVNLPDLVQQSHSPAGTPTEGLGRVSTHGQEMDSVAESSRFPDHPVPVLQGHAGNMETNRFISKYGMGSSTKASFTPFVDTRVYQTSPTDEDEDDDEESSATGKRRNINKKKKCFRHKTLSVSLHIHCDASYDFTTFSACCTGVNLLVGTENGLMLLDRSGQGKVYNLINRRRFQQMDVLEGLNVLVTISGITCFSFHVSTGKKNKLRVYYLSWLRNRILHNDPEVEKKQGWITVGDLEGCIHYKVGK
ncbi:hypothetical protein JD844_007593 [Phrynosoma platyrhinos]|uniref:non-specific serine/threonine protein kinase n=1 Tax=Phrynosoma platyrhinos TaxID=52577 RepID=A0ABQ7T3W8_PHRPL|nr:hypothetical protein JD844_007593 [Phrynosoma platyrhinos]